MFRKILLLSFCLCFAFIGQSQISDTIKLYKKSTHSPTKATLYSAILPGLGQAYNRQYWKIPVIYAAGGAVTYFAVTNYRGAQKFKKEYIARQSNDISALNPNYTNFPDESIYNLYFAYKGNFELSIIIGAGVYLLNIVDAMVYAHLFDFDISENLSMNIRPYYEPSLNPYSGGLSPTVGFSMKFNLK